VPSGCGGDDFIRVGLPSERLWVSVVVCDGSIGGSLQIDDADKSAAFERRLVSTAKKPSTAFGHEALVGVKWKVTRGWRASQEITLGCLWAA
jgi:hypothetical protein